MGTWLCINKQDGERRLLKESEAFELDNRLWMFKAWSANEAGDRGAIVRYADPVIATGIEFAPMVRKCIKCQGHHFGEEGAKCKRNDHVRYDVLNALELVMDKVLGWKPYGYREV